MPFTTGAMASRNNAKHGGQGRSILCVSRHSIDPWIQIGNATLAIPCNLQPADRLGIASFLNP